MSAKRCKSQTPDSAGMGRNPRLSLPIPNQPRGGRPKGTGERRVVRPEAVHQRTNPRLREDADSGQPKSRCACCVAHGRRLHGWTPDGVQHYPSERGEDGLRAGEPIVRQPSQVSGKISSANRRKAVMKVDQAGQVVAIYSSGREAAKKNYISQNAIWARCAGKVKDPYRLDGYDYRYETSRRA